MTSRRHVPEEKDGGASDGAISGKSDTSPAVPASVIYKLLGFTLAMVVAPLGTYFTTVNTVFRGNATYAGGLAAIMANVVLIAYVIVAWNDDQSEKMEEEQNRKKTS